ncbi:MAG: hypothetical protein ACSW8B_01655 [bacterium]
MIKNNELKAFVERIEESERLDFSEEFLDEVAELLKKKRSIKRSFFSLLNKQIDAILCFTPYELEHYNGNEILKGDLPFDCYSLHLQRKEFNIRILGMYFDDVFYMLVMFEEKSGKKATDYTKPKEKARRRAEKICLQGKKD